MYFEKYYRAADFKFRTVDGDRDCRQRAFNVRRRTAVADLLYCCDDDCRCGNCLTDDGTAVNESANWKMIRNARAASFIILLLFFPSYSALHSVRPSAGGARVPTFSALRARATSSPSIMPAYIIFYIMIYVIMSNRVTKQQ